MMQLFGFYEEVTENRTEGNRTLRFVLTVPGIVPVRFLPVLIQDKTTWDL
jgi:hypothetical protein